MKKILSILLVSVLALSVFTMNASANDAESKCALSDIARKAVTMYINSKLSDTEIDTDGCKAIEFLKGFVDIECILNGTCGNASEKDDVTAPDTDKDTCTNDNCGNGDVIVDIPEFEFPEIPEDAFDQGNDSEKDDIPTASSETEQVIALVNKYRVQNGLSELVYDEKLSLAASKRAKEQEMVFSHTRPDGTSCFTVLSEYGVSYRGAGENIAMGQTSADEVMTDWMNSEGHRANILNANFTKIGVGLYKGQNGRYYWAQMFIY